MDERELKQRTKSFSLRVLKLIDSLPNTRSANILAHQLGRSGTSVGANYRAACRSRSVAEMISKLAVVEEEVDESGFWLELIANHGLLEESKLTLLIQESNELRPLW
ncbi:MAG TPA: four helix bundle protein [Chthoniobacterales bacterium]